MAVMMAEPTHNTRAGREKAVQVLFESTSCPAIFLAKAAVLAAFAVGRQTALVLDAGHRGTTGARVGVDEARLRLRGRRRGL
jgi:actin-like protein 6A